jgi:hypothetical protein
VFSDVSCSRRGRGRPNGRGESHDVKLASVEPFKINSCVPCLESDVCGVRPHEQAWLTPRRNGVVEQRKGGPAFSAMIKTQFSN